MTRGGGVDDLMHMVCVYVEGFWFRCDSIRNPCSHVKVLQRVSGHEQRKQCPDIEILKKLRSDTFRGVELPLLYQRSFETLL